jgi:hypothetical protein
MSRIKKLENHYHEQLTKHKVKDIPVFIQFIVDADVTKGKYSRFLIESFLNDKFLEEDLIGGLESTVGQAISLFDKHKGKLPIEQRSVYALNKETKLPLYQSPGDLWNSVKQYQGELSGKELKKEEQEQVYRETEFVYKDEETGFQIVSPLTKESAQWWGKGTRWCTSADENNMFYNYVKDSPLFILLMPDGNKLQFWNNIYKNNKDKWLNDIQFMDEADNDVDIEYIEKNWNILEPICMWLNDLRFIPEQYLNEDIILNLIDSSSDVITSLRPEHITENIFLKSIGFSNYSSRGLNHIITEDNLKNITIDNNFLKKVIGANVYYIVLFKEYLDKQNIHNIDWNDILLSSIKKDGNLLQYLDKDFKDIIYNEEQLYNEAVEQDGDAISYISHEKWTKDLIFKAIKSNFKSYYFIRHYQNDFFTYDELTDLIKNNPNIISYINPDTLSDEQIKLAIVLCPNFICELPYEKRTPEICDLVFIKKPKLFYHFPTEYKEECLLKNLNKYKPYARLLDYPLESLAFSQYQIPNQKLIPLRSSKEFWLDIVKIDTLYIQDIPKDLFNKYLDDFLKSAYLTNIDDIEYIYDSEMINSENLPVEICNFILEYNKKLLCLLPEKYHTKENIIEALTMFPEEIDGFLKHDNFQEIWQKTISPRLSEQSKGIISQIVFRTLFECIELI